MGSIPGREVATWIQTVAAGDSLLVKWAPLDLKEMEDFQENGLGTYCAVVVAKSDRKVRFDKKVVRITGPRNQADRPKPPP